MRAAAQSLCSADSRWACRGELITPLADHCLPGITRATVLQLSRELGIPTAERRVSLAELHSAEEVGGPRALLRACDFVCVTLLLPLQPPWCSSVRPHQVFTTGTMGELTPVVEIDGRVVGEGVRGPITARLQDAYGKRTSHGTPIENLRAGATEAK